MRKMWMLGVAVVVTGCGKGEPLHTEEPPRVLERVTKPVKRQADAKTKKAAKGGFGFQERAGDSAESSATPENRMAPELDDLEALMRQGGRTEQARPAGLFECKRCGRQAAEPGKCCGDERHKIG
jgi:hypothetical protein